MQTTESTPSNYSPTLIGFTLFLCVLIAYLSSLSSIRHLFVDKVPQRKILSKIYTQVDSTNYTILKIQNDVGIEIEIYSKNENTFDPVLKQKLSLNNDSEAFLMIKNDSLNLVMKDFDNDGYLDIISPSVDKFGNSRLNIFKYEKDLKQFSNVSLNN